MRRSPIFAPLRRAAALAALLAAAQGLAVPTRAPAQQSVPPAQVLGRQVCQLCHKAELAAWEKSSHAQKAWGLLDHPKAAGFAKALGVTDVKSAASLCTKCHGTQMQKGDQLVVAPGNSCESCHGGAGPGARGWLLKHCDFGTGRRITRDVKMSDLLADRAREAPQQRAARDAACKKLGMNRAADAFEIASNCLQCHLVPIEKLVDAGHPISTRFEFVEWAQGEVRHNFLLDPARNAEVPTNWSDPARHGPGRTADGRKRLMFVAGQLADLAVSLRARATATSTKRGSLGDEANDRILDLQEELGEIDVAELKPVLAALADMDKKSLREITAADKQRYGQAADQVAAAARSFVEAHADGSQLPAGIEVPSKAKGDAYQP